MGLYFLPVKNRKKYYKKFNNRQIGIIYIDCVLDMPSKTDLKKKKDYFSNGLYYTSSSQNRKPNKYRDRICKTLQCYTSMWSVKV